MAKYKWIISRLKIPKKGNPAQLKYCPSERNWEIVLIYEIQKSHLKRKDLAPKSGTEKNNDNNKVFAIVTESVFGDRNDDWVAKLDKMSQYQLAEDVLQKLLGNGLGEGWTKQTLEPTCEEHHCWHHSNYPHLVLEVPAWFCWSSWAAVCYLILVTGLLTLNWVPLCRTQQKFVISTSTEIGNNSAKISNHITGAYFKNKKLQRLRTRRARSSTWRKRYARLEYFKIDQQVVDLQILPKIKANPQLQLPVVFFWPNIFTLKNQCLKFINKNLIKVT